MAETSGIKWPTIVVLPILAIATALDWYFVWGLLFIYWAVPNVLSGEAYLVERVSRSEAPVLFWIITLMWLGFGLWTVIADLTWRLS